MDNSLAPFDFNKYSRKFTKEQAKKQPHEKASLVNEIEMVVGKSEKYSFTYWLRKLKDFENKGGSVATVLAWLKMISDYPSDFNKGAILTNKLKNYGVKSTTNTGTEKKS